jgi:peptidyl-tRNA hydrolase, PTH2 family
MEPKQVIIIRTDTEPKMRKGKMCAQSAHASLAVLLNNFFGEYGKRNWEVKKHGDLYESYHKEVILHNGDPITEWINNSFVKIVLQGNLSDVVNSYSEAKKQGIPCSLIEDKGLTEFGGKVTITCCAIGPDNPEKIDKITGHLKLL